MRELQAPYHIDNNEEKSVVDTLSTALEEPVNAPKVSQHHGPADWA
jgi:hypothetical protein